MRKVCSRFHDEQCLFFTAAAHLAYFGNKKLFQDGTPPRLKPGSAPTSSTADGDPTSNLTEPPLRWCIERLSALGSVPVVGTRVTFRTTLRRQSAVTFTLRGQNATPAVTLGGSSARADPLHPQQAAGGRGAPQTLGVHAFRGAMIGQGSDEHPALRGGTRSGPPGGLGLEGTRGAFNPRSGAAAGRGRPEGPPPKPARVTRRHPSGSPCPPAPSLRPLSPQRPVPAGTEPTANASPSRSTAPRATAASPKHLRRGRQARRQSLGKPSSVWRRQPPPPPHLPGKESGQEHLTALTPFREQTTTLEATASTQPPARSATAHARASPAPGRTGRRAGSAGRGSFPAAARGDPAASAPQRAGG
ncbi:collagen alpha-1(I) chain-like [Equus przewalskii]|uniref:Collagen alpha-1(I) chain-like n=1 Tax=Equus przewalskii TaxID=9798 RepID=A0ABM4L2G9_EQUPR